MPKLLSVSSEALKVEGKGLLEPSGNIDSDSGFCQTFVAAKLRLRFDWSRPGLGSIMSIMGSVII